jgi:hypothetical protein
MTAPAAPRTDGGPRDWPGRRTKLAAPGNICPENGQILSQSPFDCAMKRRNAVLDGRQRHARLAPQRLSAKVLACVSECGRSVKKA